MSSRQARRERRAAERKAKKVELKKSRLFPVAAPPLQAGPRVEPRWNPELEDEVPRQVQIRNNAMLDRIALKAGLTIPTGVPALGAYSGIPPEQLPLRNPAQPAPVLECPAGVPIGFVSQTEPVPSARAAINRRNAQNSTGPRSPAGKLTSSRNSVKHGLASGQVILPGEDPAAFDTLLHDFLDEHRPATPTEQLLVEDMAQRHWLTQRAIRFQNQCFTPDGVNQQQLALFLRYQTTHERAFYKALNTLLKLRKIGFVSHPAPQPAAAAGFVSQAAPMQASNAGFVWHAAGKFHPGGAAGLAVPAQ